MAGNKVCVGDYVQCTNSLNKWKGVIKEIAPINNTWINDGGRYAHIHRADGTRGEGSYLEGFGQLYVIPVDREDRTVELRVIAPCLKEGMSVRVREDLNEEMFGSWGLNDTMLAMKGKIVKISSVAYRDITKWDYDESEVRIKEDHYHWTILCFERIDDLKLLGDGTAKDTKFEIGQYVESSIECLSSVGRRIFGKISSISEEILTVDYLGHKEMIHKSWVTKVDPNEGV